MEEICCTLVSANLSSQKVHYSFYLSMGNTSPGTCLWPLCWLVRGVRAQQERALSILLGKLLGSVHE